MDRRDYIPPHASRESPAVELKQFCNLPRAITYGRSNSITSASSAREAHLRSSYCVITHVAQLSLSQFVAGTHAGAAHGGPGAPPASAAERPCPEPCQALSQRQRPKPLVAGGHPCSREGPLLRPAQCPG